MIPAGVAIEDSQTFFPVATSASASSNHLQLSEDYAMFWSIEKVTNNPRNSRADLFSVQTYNTKFNKKKQSSDNILPLSCRGQLTLSSMSQNYEILRISNLKPDLHNYNARIKFGENPLRFTQVIVLKQKYGYVVGRSLCKNWGNLSIPKADLYNINAHTKFPENPLIFMELLSQIEYMDVSLADNSVKN